MQMQKSDGSKLELEADHVIAATGYKLDLHKLGFLEPQLASQLRSVDGAPVLKSNFESSIPGLYFIGAMGAPSFGPVLRFAFGAGFTSRRLSQVLARRAV
jgi:hypothetical protein